MTPEPEYLLDYGQDPSETAVFRPQVTLDPEQRIDVWFCDGSGYSPIGEFELAGEIVEIACVGEMDWRVGDQRWRSAWDIPSSVTTDEELLAVMQDEAEVVMNCWIEVFDPSDWGGMSAYVVGSIDEAFDAARDLAREMRRARQGVIGPD